MINVYTLIFTNFTYTGNILNPSGIETHYVNSMECINNFIVFKRLRLHSSGYYNCSIIITD